MAQSSFSSADYLSALQALLPRGRAWPRESTSAQSEMLAGLAPTYQRPEWEATLGLPSACTGTLPTLQARQAAVVGQLASVGGQSIPYFVGVAAKLGYPITITQYAPFRCGQSSCGQPLGGAAWFYAWRVNAPTYVITSFSTGRSAMGEPLRSWANQTLPCVLSEYAPAHTILNFKYS